PLNRSADGLNILPGEVSHAYVLFLSLPATEEQHVRPLGIGPSPDRVRADLDVDAAPLRAVAEGDDVPAVAVNVHEIRVEVGDVELHQSVLPERSDGAALRERLAEAQHRGVCRDDHDLAPFRRE